MPRFAEAVRVDMSASGGGRRELRLLGDPADIEGADRMGAIQGTELCAVAELMYSCEQLYARTGAEKWAERLELIAFNAFPAAFSDDMWAHRYDQQSNQIACERFPGRPMFRTNNCEAVPVELWPYGCAKLRVTELPLIR